MEYVAGGSGAVLGFIHKDIPGAIAGYKLGRSLYRNLPKKKTMPPIKRKTTPSTPRSDRSKRSRASTTPGSARRVLFQPRVSRQRSGTNVVTGADKRIGKKVKKEGRVKRLKVSKAFRKKVKQSLETHRGTGWFRETVTIEKLNCIDSQQNVLTPGRLVNGTVGNFFSPTYIRYVASHLYNKLAPTQNITVNDTNLYPVANLKIDVIEQNYVMKFRNNSPRTYDVTLVDYSPKSNNSITTSFEDSWTTALVNGGPFGAAGTVGQESRENVGNATKNTMGNHPKFMAVMRHYYSMDTVHVKLEPGKEYYHKVKGPNMMTYDFNKYFKNSNFHDIQKFCKGTLVMCSLDLTSTTLATHGRYTDIPTADPQGMVIETTHFTKIKCPERAGFQIPNVAVPIGSIQPISQQSQHAWSIVYPGTAQAGVVEYRQDENPLSNVVET